VDGTARLSNGGLAAIPTVTATTTATPTAAVDIAAATIGGQTLRVVAATDQLDVAATATAFSGGIGTDPDATTALTSSPTARATVAAGPP
ncbi:MAG: hypothetical protein K2X87_25760, partial [Gemmataceae bacterium]|nr:hypothetical protein [Gemmataceae bacterium]